MLRKTAERLDLFSRMAACFEDQRKADQITHTLSSLLAQRVTGIALGYEDLTDHDSLRHDPMLKLLGEPDGKGNEPPKSLAGSSIQGRMERSFQDNNRRYHKITAQPKRLQDLFVDLFLESHHSPPDRITLDIDATDIETHGSQIGGFFQGYDEHRCFLPLYVTCGPHLLVAKLRHGNVDGAEGAKGAIKRIVTRIRKSWPKVGILVRGDSGFARDNLMRWCETNSVDFILGLPRNTVLVHRARKIRSRAALEFLETNTTTKVFGHFTHKTRSNSWTRLRHVIAKVLHREGQDQRCRFLVTSLDWNSPHVTEAMPNTIREKLQKIGARVIISVRRIRIAMPDACPTRGIFFTACRRLALP